MLEKVEGTLIRGKLFVQRKIAQFAEDSKGFGTVEMILLIIAAVVVVALVIGVLKHAIENKANEAADVITDFQP